MMDLVCEERSADSPFIERVWRNRSEDAGSFISMAETHCEMVVTRCSGKVTMTVRGPETQATPAYCPPEAEFLGIQFRLGTRIPYLPPSMVMNRHDVNLPEASSQSFWLHGSVWEFPDFENAETFVDRLVRAGLLIHEPLVNTVLQGQPPPASVRTVQRRFLQATGLTHGIIRQIERARYATILLKQGASILDTVYQAGYADQPHLTRSLKYYIGQTPAQISSESKAEPLSFLFKTQEVMLGYDPIVRSII
ncbi:MAG TPA: helix-turn-helix domain-containing protein [Aggregatilineaceae bacterium]|nr:helix-turn-helix domain-containing protein [Aggregatilineaceae bacterium]